MNDSLTPLASFDAVIFDLDGLLIDSERIYMRAWIEGAGRLGFELDLAFYQSIVGMPYHDCLEILQTHLGPSFPIDAFQTASNEVRVGLLADGMPLKPGAVELLDFLSARETARAVASSSQRQYVIGHLTDLAIDRYFDAIVTRSDVTNGKPHPEPFLRAAEAMGVDPARCLALEDSRNGIRSAAAAGMNVVMVPDLLPPDAELKSACVQIADDLNAVRAWLAGGQD